MESTKKNAPAKTEKAPAQEQPVREKTSRLDKVIGSMTKIAPLQGGKGHR